MVMEGTESIAKMFSSTRSSSASRKPMHPLEPFAKETPLGLGFCHSAVRDMIRLGKDASQNGTDSFWILLSA